MTLASSSRLPAPPDRGLGAATVAFARRAPSPEALGMTDPRSFDLTIPASRIRASSEKMESTGTHTLNGIAGIVVHNPFRRGWSVRLGPLRLRSVPWYWDVLRERLAESAARQRPVPPSPAHHDHYCEECDRQWVHGGHTCAHPWAFPCGKSHRSPGTGRQRLGPWVIVVRRDRAELGKHLGASFEADQRVTVVVDRRQSERRVQHVQSAPVAAERRRWGDRRAPQADEDGSMWASLGFRVVQERLPGPR